MGDKTKSVKILGPMGFGPAQWGCQGSISFVNICK